MKCRACENELPKGREWGTPEKPGRLACLLPGCPTHGLNPRTKQYSIEVMGRSPADVENSIRNKSRKGVETKRAAGFFDDKANNPYSLEFWIKKGLSIEEAQEKLSKKGQKGSQTKHDNGFFDDKANNPYSLKFWIKKGLSIEEAQLKIRQKNHNCTEYWVVRGHVTEEAEVLAANSAGTNSLPELKKRYGDEEGTARYIRVRQRLSASWNPASSAGRSFSSSKAADLLFVRLYRFIRRLGYARDDVQCNLNRGELYLRDENSIYFYDFVLRPLKLIIEFNGEHVHPRKDKLTENQWKSWKHAYSRKTADEIHAYNERKMYAAVQAGYNVLMVWSKDLDTFERSTAFIKEQHDKRKDYQAEPQSHGRATGCVSKQQDD